MVLSVLSNLRYFTIPSHKFPVNLVIQPVGFGFFRTRETLKTVGNTQLMCAHVV